MASVFKKPGTRSPYWYAAFTDATGRRVQRSTKERNRAIAADRARDWEKLAQKGRAGTLTAAQARIVVAEIVKDATGEDLTFFTCREWFAEWLAGKKGVIGERSEEKYIQVTDDFLDHLGARADLTVAAVSPKDVRSFRDTLAAQGRAPSTVNQMIRKVLSVPFAAAQKLGYIPTNPCAAVEALKDDASRSRDTFTSEQVGALLKAAEGNWEGAILTGYFTGLRLRDVAEMTWSSIDVAESLIRIKTTKTGVELTLPLHEDLAAWLRKQPRGIGKAKVFPELSGKGTGGRYGLSGLFKTIMELAGISGRVTRSADGKGRTINSLSFHSLRHSFVSALANAGVPQDLRQKLSGHADDETHTRYTHHDIANLRTAVAKMPSVV